jgi:hypothetical protein
MSATAIMRSRNPRPGPVRRSYGLNRSASQPEPYATARTDRSQAEAKQALADGSEWLSCHCCGKVFPAGNMVRFHDYSDDAVCVHCVEWLHVRSRPIVRRLYPIWQLPTRIRARTVRPENYATGNDQG